MTTLDIKAVIFDYGKVLCLPQNETDIACMIALLDVERSHFNAAYAKFRPMYDRGDLNDFAYWSAVAVACGRTATPSLTNQLADLDMTSWTRPNFAMTAWAQSVQQSGCKTAILSNMQASLRRRLLELCPWLPNFDCAIFSSDIGVIKPEPEIYCRCLATLEVQPQCALFIDDVAENIAAAQHVGMHGLVFSSVEELSEQLMATFSPPLPALP